MDQNTREQLKGGKVGHSAPRPDTTSWTPRNDARWRAPVMAEAWEKIRP
jgi:hypothetical protein